MPYITESENQNRLLKLNEQDERIGYLEDQLQAARVLLLAVQRGEQIAPALLTNCLDEIEQVLARGKPFNTGS